MTDRAASFSIGDLVASPRTTALALSPDGARLVAVVAAPDAKRSAYTSALWQIDPTGADAPIRLTFSAKGESAPAFLPDGSLVFTSARPDPGDPDAEDTALWRLPAAGEASVLARTPGGVRSPIVSTGTGTVLVASSRLVGSVDEADDERRRTDRKENEYSAIVHDGMPIRFWDAELGDASHRLFVLDPGTTALRDIAPDARFELLHAESTISADGALVLTTWSQRLPGGRTRNDVVSIDPVTTTRTVLLTEPAADFSQPQLAPDGVRYAVLRYAWGTFDTPFARTVQIHRVDGSGPQVELVLGDLTATEYVWSVDGSVLFVTGDLHGRGAVLAVDPGSGKVVRTLAADASYSQLLPAPDGRAVFALRSAVDRPGVPVRLDAQLADQEPAILPAPGAMPALPGTVARVSQQTGAVTVSGWLCLPHPADGPVPLLTWVHGGPFTSWNSWSWRWCPWVAVARGYAVLLPDPALSTGYGNGCIERAWPHRAAVVWGEVQALLDGVLDAPEFGLDRERTGLLGASFGGYMTNWVAGHTDRFRAIVTHAGLWALDQQHATTDMAAYKNSVFGRPEDHPQWYAENSPDRSRATISTPMLIVHGNKDYRVPVSEALRLWWDLVSGFDGAPEDLPHRFLQFTSENHWILSPTNAAVWYETVLAFCDRHLGRD